LHHAIGHYFEAERGEQRRECNGKRDCLVANLFKVFDTKQDLSTGNELGPRPYT
jgi:hypothetical protein